MTSAVPDLPVPDIVSMAADGGAVDAVWINGVGGVTYRVGAGARYVKWQPHHPEVSLSAEAAKLMWASRFVCVPRVIDVGVGADADWLITGALPGESAVCPRWVADPSVAVQAVGRGLRELHDRLPVDECPWEWAPSARIVDATSRGLDVPDRLNDAPPVDRAVVCHGDACCPNTLLDDGGDPAGHVDLGSLGVADRWADIAVAAMSTEWNYGRAMESELVAAYGIPMDTERMEYYRDLWNAT